jgi:asparagine synthase (glutamine-hydrolysing)
MNDFLERLDKSVAPMCEKKTAVVFSGGVDSSLLAVLAARHCSVTAYTVGVEEAPDLPFAAQLKSHFHHEIIKLSDDDIDKELGKIVPIIKKTEGEVSPVRVGAEFPSYFAAKAAAEDGFKVVLSGQGPDEMFGGYARYMPVLHEKGYGALEKLLKSDTYDLKDRIINIDKAVCKFHGLELRNPFLSDDFVEYGLSLDVRERMWSGKKKPDYPYEVYKDLHVIRKFCEKKAAEEILPKEIVWRPKKAAQYGSGIHKVLERLARSHGFKEKAAKAKRSDYLTMFLESRL